MTVEVLLMNQTGAALCADSAVSMRNPDGRLITQTEAPKTFVLNPDSASGMTVFGIGRFSGCPWTTVVDTFRGRGLGREATLAATADAFASHLAYLADTDHVSAGQGEHMFRMLAAETLVELYRRAERLVGQAGLARPEALARALADLLHEVEFDTLYDETGAPRSTPRPRLGVETPRLKAIVDGSLDEIVAIALRDLFDETPRAADHAADLARLIRIGLMTDWVPPAADTSGVVIAGFGADDHAPAFVHLEVTGLIGDFLKYRVVETGKAGADTAPVIRAFAQNAAIDRFLYGSDVEFVLDAANAVYHLNQQGIAAATQAAGLGPAPAAQIWRLVEEAIWRGSLVGILNARQLRRREVETTFGLKVAASSIEPLGRLAAQLLGLAVLESEMTGNATVSRPYSILRLTRGSAQIETQTEIR